MPSRSSRAKRGRSLLRGVQERLHVNANADGGRAAAGQSAPTPPAASSGRGRSRHGRGASRGNTSSPRSDDPLVPELRRSRTPQPPRSNTPQPPRSSTPQPPRSSTPQPPRSTTPQQQSRPTGNNGLREPRNDRSGLRRPTSSGSVSRTDAIATDKSWRVPEQASGHEYQQRMFQLYQRLKNWRQEERRIAIRDGKLADPEKKRKLKDAITPVGTCPDMCPEFERVERIVQSMVDGAEKATVPDAQFKVPVEARMIKRFRRSAAGFDEQLPSDIRPPAVLLKTLNYLLDEVVGGPQPLAAVHKFVWDRTRSIRNDFSIQQVSKPQDLRMAVDCHERIARFHILSLHQLSDPARGASAAEFDAFQEFEQLNNTLMSLREYYDDLRDTHRFPNEAEFRAYLIIVEIYSRRPDGDARAMSWPPDLMSHPRVDVALRLQAAAHDTVHLQGPMRPLRPWRLTGNSHALFWSIIASPQVSYLLACIAEYFFNWVRCNALRNIFLAHRRYHRGPLPRTRDLLVSGLTRALGYDNDDQTISFCQQHNFKLRVRSEDRLSYLDLSSWPDMKVIDRVPDRPHLFSQRLVESKRHGRRLQDVINGRTVAQCRALKLIDRPPNMKPAKAKRADPKEPSLFVPDPSKKKKEKKPPKTADGAAVPAKKPAATAKVACKAPAGGAAATGAKAEPPAPSTAGAKAKATKASKPSEAAKAAGTKTSSAKPSSTSSKASTNPFAAGQKKLASTASGTLSAAPPNPFASLSQTPSPLSAPNSAKPASPFAPPANGVQHNPFAKTAAALKAKPAQPAQAANGPKPSSAPAAGTAGASPFSGVANGKSALRSKQGPLQKGAAAASATQPAATPAPAPASKLGQTAGSAFGGSATFGAPQQAASTPFGSPQQGASTTPFGSPQPATAKMKTDFKFGQPATAASPFASGSAPQPSQAMASPMLGTVQPNAAPTPSFNFVKPLSTTTKAQAPLPAAAGAAVKTPFGASPFAPKKPSPLAKEDSATSAFAAPTAASPSQSQSNKSVLDGAAAPKTTKSFNFSSSPSSDPSGQMNTAPSLLQPPTSQLQGQGAPASRFGTQQALSFGKTSATSPFATAQAPSQTFGQAFPAGNISTTPAFGTGASSTSAPQVAAGVASQPAVDFGAKSASAFPVASDSTAFTPAGAMDQIGTPSQPFQQFPSSAAIAPPPQSQNSALFPSNAPPAEPQQPTLSPAERREQRLDDIARTYVTEQGGMMDQLLELVVAQIAEQEVQKFEREKAQAARERARHQRLGLQYLLRWRALTRHSAVQRLRASLCRSIEKLRAEQAAREAEDAAREAARKAADPFEQWLAGLKAQNEASRAAAEKNGTYMAPALPALTNGVKGQGSAATPHASTALTNGDNGEGSSTMAPPAQSPPTPPQINGVKRKEPDSPPEPTDVQANGPKRAHRHRHTQSHSAALEAQRLARAVGESRAALAASAARMRSTYARAARAIGDHRRASTELEHAAPSSLQHGLALQRLEREGGSTAALRHSAALAGSRRRDTTKGDYFKLKARGIDPDSADRSSVRSLKRGRADDDATHAHRPGSPKYRRLSTQSFDGVLPALNGCAEPPRGANLALSASAPPASGPLLPAFSPASSSPTPADASPASLPPDATLEQRFDATLAAMAAGLERSRAERAALERAQAEEAENAMLRARARRRREEEEEARRAGESRTQRRLRETGAGNGWLWTRARPVMERELARRRAEKEGRVFEEEEAVEQKPVNGKGKAPAEQEVLVLDDDDEDEDAVELVDGESGDGLYEYEEEDVDEEEEDGDEDEGVGAAAAGGSQLQNMGTSVDDAIEL